MNCGESGNILKIIPRIGKKIDYLKGADNSERTDIEYPVCILYVFIFWNFCKSNNNILYLCYSNNNDSEIPQNAVSRYLKITI
jgi:hypothetical protein